MQPKLSYRVALDTDYDLLIGFRRECGWGEPDVRSHWKDTDRVYCVFESEIDGTKVDVGMGAWYLDMVQDREMASRVDKVIRLSALYISSKYRRLGFGSQALQILEREAVDRFGAVKVTLDTTAYLNTRSPDNTYWMEDFTRPGRTIAWYIEKGYSQFRETRPLYQHPTPDDPNRLLTAIFMCKSADAIREESRALAASTPSHLKHHEQSCVMRGPIAIEEVSNGH